MNDHVHPAFAPALRSIAPPVSQRITATLTWIPTREAYPDPELFYEPGSFVLASVEGEKYAVPAVCLDGKTWCDLDGYELDGAVTRWAERPAGITP